MQYTGEPMNAYDISMWAHEGMPLAANAIIINHGSHLTVRTLEGCMVASHGDWIIKGVKGEFYPCKPDIFKATYEPADGPSTPAPAAYNRQNP